jgi:hydrogenase/urease accessory protein HupE
VRRALLLLLAVVLAAAAGATSAHEMRPAYLELRQTGPETYDVLWKVPARGEDQRFGLYVRLPEGCADATPARGFMAGGAFIERWSVTCAGGLTGGTVRIDGLSATLTDVLARIERGDGTVQVTRLMPSSPSFVIEAAPSPARVAATYLRLGVEHILLGFDHLLFVFALVLIVSGGRTLVMTITAFTVAHSITLTLATLGVVHVPGPPVEATIALSILLLACEIVRLQRGQPGLTAGRPWVVAFSFGLLHGFGFAGALTEIGLPRGDVPLALLAFNAGVELGQLAFIAAALGTLALAARIGLPSVVGRRALTAATYVIGTLAAFWFFERLAGFGA